MGRGLAAETSEAVIKILDYRVEHARFDILATVVMVGPGIMIL
jgi:hypothetical protein